MNEIGYVRLKLNTYIDNRNITRYRLAMDSGIGYAIIDKYYRNNLQRYDSYVLAKICAALDCKIEDIIEYVKNDSKPE